MATETAFFVQDHERCLWCSEPRLAMKEQGLTLLEDYPKCSQDLNAIEVAWREVRNRFAETEPASRETRRDFIVRLRNAVAWVNSNRSDYLLHQCRNQKDRARDVKKLGSNRQLGWFTSQQWIMFLFALPRRCAVVVVNDGI